VSKAEQESDGLLAAARRVDNPQQVNNLHHECSLRRCDTGETMNWQKEIDFARLMAEAAGQNAVRIRESGIVAEAKADDSPVTIADRENERLIREAIEGEFPLDGLVGEEGSSKQGESGRRWIIDPIDGTRDFVRGNRFWCVLIALAEAEEPVAGVAHFPLLGETYWAARGGGSHCNEERLHVSTIDALDRCGFCPNGLQLPAARRYLTRVAELMQKTWSVRSYGGALDACLLASGKTEIWFEPKVEVWDLAPLEVIIEEAGGLFFAADGQRRIDRGTAIGCVPGVAQAVREAFGIGN